MLIVGFAGGFCLGTVAGLWLAYFVVKGNGE